MSFRILDKGVNVFLVVFSKAVLFEPLSVDRLKMNTSLV